MSRVVVNYINKTYEYIPSTYEELINMSYEELCKEKENIEAGFDLYESVRRKEDLKILLIRQPEAILKLNYYPSEEIWLYAFKKLYDIFCFLQYHGDNIDLFTLHFYEDLSVKMITWYNGNNDEIYKLAMKCNIKNYFYFKSCTKFKNEIIFKNIVLDILEYYSNYFYNNPILDNDIIDFVLDVNEKLKYDSDKKFILLFNDLFFNKIWKECDNKECIESFFDSFQNYFSFTEDQYCEILKYFRCGLAYIDDKIKTERMCITSVKHHKYYYDIISRYIPNRIKTEDFLIKVINLNPNNIRYISNPSYKLCKLAITQDPFIINYIQGRYYSIDKIAVTEVPRLIDYIDNQTPELCKIAVSKDPSTIQYIEDQTPELVKLALQKDINNIKYIKDLHVIEQLKEEEN